MASKCPVEGIGFEETEKSPITEKIGIDDQFDAKWLSFTGMSEFRNDLTNGGGGGL